MLFYITYFRVFLPASDIPSYVAEGNVDVGITGSDVVAESEVDVDLALVTIYAYLNRSFTIVKKSYNCSFTIYRFLDVK